MLKELRKFLRKKQKLNECADLLGTNDLVYQFANFWDTYKDEIMLVAAVHLHRFELDCEYTKDEMAAYKKGLADTNLFFEKCSKEFEKQKKERANAMQEEILQV